MTACTCTTLGHCAPCEPQRRAAQSYQVSVPPARPDAGPLTEQTTQTASPRAAASDCRLEGGTDHLSLDELEVDCA